MAAHPDSTGDSRLVGYVVPAPGADVNTRALRTRMSGRLPAYTVPTTRGKLQVAAARVSLPARCAKEPAG
ncbi:hypothetical protein ABR738_05080 [Streptomyces sp. Edi4]|uniref:hypothetical protein n=1 Tax=Streptomyces sp. Edi4 TaxID=3162527 RepID=UPI003305CC12